VPPASEMGPRLETVLQVVYLVFNEGYSASSGSAVVLTDLTDEAVRLGRLLVRLLPQPEALGLLALMLLHQARLAARSGPGGEVILLEDQDRSLWDGDKIREGAGLVRAALGLGRPGPYTLQAALAAVHASAPSTSATDWGAIVDLYDRLLLAVPSPVVALNRAVAVSMKEGPAAGLELVEGILESGALEGYHLAHSTRGELCLRAGRIEEARASFEHALQRAEQEPERRLLKKKLEACRIPPSSLD
jgi:RNA polymerase sigma-70 factor, ECF subfamily